jgi:hypothetical protein
MCWVRVGADVSFEASLSTFFSVPVWYYRCQLHDHLRSSRLIPTASFCALVRLYVSRVVLAPDRVEGRWSRTEIWFRFVHIDCSSHREELILPRRHSSTYTRLRSCRKTEYPRSVILRTLICRLHSKTCHVLEGSSISEIISKPIDVLIA